MKELIGRIKQDRGHHVICLSFEPENELAMRLYEKLGFEVDGCVVTGERFDWGYLNKGRNSA